MEDLLHIYLFISLVYLYGWRIHGMCVCNV